MLRLGRLAAFYDASHDQLPAVLAHQDLDAHTVTADRWTHDVQACRVWLFALPSGQITAAVSLDVTGDPLDTIPLLEDLYYGELTLDGRTLEEHLTHLLAQRHPEAGPVTVLPERHQLVFAHPGTDTMPTDDVLQRLIYRADLPARDTNGDSAIQHPAEMNRRPTTRAALGPYVSILIGQQDYVENAAFLSAVHVVTAAARLRQIRQHAYDGVAVLRASTRTDTPMTDRRLALEDTANRLRGLELDLSYSVEAVADLGMLIPALRVENYHQTLIDSMSLAQRADTTGRMLERLANAIDAELTAIESAESRADDARRIRTAVAVTFITTVGGTIGLLFTYLGINAREVDSTRSMFDPHYLGIYLFIAALALTGLLIFTGLRWFDRSDQTR